MRKAKSGFWILRSTIWSDKLLYRQDYARAINKALGEPENTISESSARRFQGPAEDLVKYMRFVDEAELNDPIQGTTAFAREFSARGPRDRQGRSLRDLDLRTRLLQYPCS
jgi:hypothetical protein